MEYEKEKPQETPENREWLGWQLTASTVGNSSHWSSLEATRPQEEATQEYDTGRTQTANGCLKG